MARHPVFDALERFLHPRALKPSLSENDWRFLERCREVVGQHEADPEFTATMAASLLGMSRMHLNRKLRALTGQSTHEFIRTMRLETARDLLQKHMPVELIAGSVGFKSSSHFAKVFRQRFGAKPSAYRTMKSLAREPPRMKSSGE